MIRTNVMRLLNTAAIEYSTMEYEVDENDLSGVHVAKLLGQPVEQVFKTLVLQGDRNKYIVCCIPCADELDLKKVAKATGDKKLEMLPLKELLNTTGYIRGGCSPIGMKKKFPTYIDETAVLFDKIAVSAGTRGAQVIINPEDLCQYVQAEMADLVK